MQKESDREYDIIIVGGGPGGYVCAIRAAQVGARVALVEKEFIGGMCLNWGCIPTKALVASLEVFETIRDAAKYGIDAGPPTANFPRMMERKDQIVLQLRKGVEELLKGYKVDIVRGTGTIINPRLVRAAGLPPDERGNTTRDLPCRNIIIATGSLPQVLNVPGSDNPRVITARGALDLKGIPKSMIVIGGGVTAIEFIRLLRPLGTQMQIVKRSPKILPEVDEEIGRRYQQLLKSDGVAINIGARVREIVPVDSGVRLIYDTDEGEKKIDAEYLLMAAGNVPYTRGLGLENLNVAMNKGAIVVDEFMHTNVPGISAIGDATGGAMLAHVATYQGEIAAENAMGRRRRADYRAVPAAIFASPEIAGVGVTEDEARAAGTEFTVSRFPFSALGKAVAIGKTVGFVKMVCEKSTGAVIGVHIMGPHASDLIAEAALAIQIEAAAEDVAHTIHTHPTLPEAIMEAAQGQLLGYIHYRKLELAKPAARS